MEYKLREAPSHVDSRPPILKSYKENMFEYLTKVFPVAYDRNLIRQIIEEQIQHDLKRPKCKAIVYPEPGECDLRELDLAKYIKNHSADVIAPCGTMFKCDPENVPPSVRYNDSCRLDRKKFKKLMFQCFEKGDMFGYDLNDKKQGLKKIKNNSIIGAHGFEGSPFYDKESFGAITSLGRNGVIMTYTLTEQCLANNFYWCDAEKILNHIITVAMHAPSQEVIDDLKQRFNLFIPKPMELADRLLESAKYYIPTVKRRTIRQKVITIFTNMSENERAYVFYRRSLINLFVYNSDIFREMIDGLRSIDTTLEQLPNYQELLDNTDPADILKIAGDLSQMLAIIYNNVLEFNSANRDLVKEHPDKAKKFALIAKYAKEHLDKYEDLYIPFVYAGETVARIPENKYILRKTVAVSDTDSILFTMKSPVSWYLKGDLKICKAGIDMSAYVVYQLSKILNIANRDLAISKGSVGDNVALIDLKSEYLYAVFVKTDLGKHYYTKYLAKEGRVQPKPKLDVKGVELQSSTLPEVSRKFASDLMSTILDDVYTHGDVYEADLVGACLEYEKSILEYLKSGKLGFYSNVSVKSKTEYKNPERSIYFNYLFWHEVFEEDYGPIHIPGKYPVVPFKEKIARSPMYLTWLQNGYPSLHARYMRFLSKLPDNKKLTRLPIPGELTELPKPLLPVVDIRSIIYKNMSPAQLALRQLGIAFAKQKQKPLFLDQYSSITDETLSF